ncbi:MAG: type II toxin-antitoxin system HicB family antitoxin [bacterium]
MEKLNNKLEYDYLVWKEGKYYVSQCINVNVSSFGENVDEAIANLREAVELYYQDEDIEPLKIEHVILGRESVYV